MDLASYLKLRCIKEMQQFQKLLFIGRFVNSGCDILTHPTANMFVLRLV